MKTTELTGAALNWAVSQCVGISWEQGDLDAGEYGLGFEPAINWGDGGPIIEREGISVCYDIELSQDESRSHWATIYAVDSGEGRIYGPTPLIAAMRCYVASKLGDKVEIPEELTE